MTFLNLASVLDPFPAGYETDLSRTEITWLTRPFSSSVQKSCRQRCTITEFSLWFRLLREFLLPTYVLSERPKMERNTIGCITRAHRHRTEHHFGTVRTIHIAQETVRPGFMVRILCLDTGSGLEMSV